MSTYVVDGKLHIEYSAPTEQAIFTREDLMVLLILLIDAEKEVGGEVHEG
jgi:hypothetical protein